ncbi:O-methyltransferase [Oceanomicrobium pacificus]|uniref:Class I SAM-dependent methyltransferase n=1 Tax=Oceanomicrobium pacificus TaxID=2692916 RepID=A0A6B0TU03_9RHOB|nr:class I SAM-dependent methyltransferase [Oceanomicrobium pacificus]MXU65128.1 hypothetical protein [Oceanomicrobium pacificus]
MNDLSALAEKFGSDKGPGKHRYTELYHMLFAPFRDRDIRFLEMGLQIGGPEHERSVDRQTTDLPSVRMWLEYFRKAHITGLDVSDFSWFSDPRFTFIRCNMDNEVEIAEVAAEQEAFDIIIDDASHASHHQQHAFVHLFPKLKSGGLYIIEDLRWQPPVYETRGYPKTAALFGEYLETNSFTHPVSGLQEAFNEISNTFSGCFLFQAKFLKRRKDQVLVVHKV